VQLIEPENHAADQGTLITRGRYIEDLRDALRKGQVYGLEEVPKRIKGVIETEAWRERLIEKTGEVHQFGSFEEFVMTPPLEGLGTSVSRIKDICQNDPTALDAIDRATGKNQGKRTDLVANRNEVQEEKRPVGETRQQALRALREKHHDLHKQVLDGDKKPHTAMREAGLRRKRVSVYVDDPAAAARTLIKHFDPDELYGALISARTNQ
jgi:hypothetical protein